MTDEEIGFMGLPVGARDLLPPASRVRRSLTQTLLRVFEAWGYEQAMTPLLEYDDVLARGLSDTARRQCVRFIEPGGHRVVSLRSDVTPQIARMVSQQGLGRSGRAIVRLCYAAELVRLPTQDRDPTEQHQAGVELIGDGQPASDAELISLCNAAIESAGLSGFRIDLGHREVAETVLDRLRLATPVRLRIEALLARKDRATLEDMLRQHSVPAAKAAAVAALTDAYGSASVLGRVEGVLREAGCGHALDGIRGVLEILQETDPAAHERVHLDLGEIRGFDYYTGLRLRVWAPGEARPIVRGGRYDDLFGRYGAEAPATGFMVDLDALEHALREAGRVAGLGEQLPARVIALAPNTGRIERCRADQWARRARAEGWRAWVEPDLEWEDALRRASSWDARALTWVQTSGVERHAVRSGATWTEE